MTEFDAARFVALCQRIQTIMLSIIVQPIGFSYSIDEDTSKINSKKFSSKLEKLMGSSEAKLNDAIKKSKEATDDLKKVTDELTEDSLIDLYQECMSLNLKFSALEIERIQKKYVETKKITPADMDNISKRVIDELGVCHFFQITSEKQEYYTMGDNAFGKPVIQAFPSGAYEIDEAAKCFSLGRSTAAIFHLMRLLELSIRAIAKCLSIPDPINGKNKNWGNILKEIKAEIETRNQSKTWQLNDQQFFADAYASLIAVKDAWRNTTMHVEKKYTDEEAEHIFVIVRAFIQKIACRMDEAGLPVA